MRMRRRLRSEILIWTSSRRTHANYFNHTKRLATHEDSAMKTSTESEQESHTSANRSGDAGYDVGKSSLAAGNLTDLEIFLG